MKPTALDYVRPELPFDVWAAFSPDRVYRYTLWREWNPDLPYMQIIGLNPSTADEVQDDPTVRRCIRFARDAGYGALCMTNAFAYRSTDPRKMKLAADPVGPENDAWLLRVASEAAVVVAAWGTHGAFRNRDREIARLIPNLHCFRTTAAGFPSHPLYLPASLRPVVYKPR